MKQLLSQLVSFNTPTHDAKQKTQNNYLISPQHQESRKEFGNIWNINRVSNAKSQAPSVNQHNPSQQLKQSFSEQKQQIDPLQMHQILSENARLKQQVDLLKLQMLKQTQFDQTIVTNSNENSTIVQSSLNNGLNQIRSFDSYQRAQPHTDIQKRKKSIQQLRKIECKERFENQSIEQVNIDDDFDLTTNSDDHLFGQNQNAGYQSKHRQMPLKLTKDQVILGSTHQVPVQVEIIHIKPAQRKQDCQIIENYSDFLQNKQSFQDSLSNTKMHLSLTQHLYNNPEEVSATNVFSRNNLAGCDISSHHDSFQSYDDPPNLSKAVHQNKLQGGINTGVHLNRNLELASPFDRFQEPKEVYGIPMKKELLYPTQIQNTTQNFSQSQLSFSQDFSDNRSYFNELDEIHEKTLNEIDLDQIINVNDVQQLEQQELVQVENCIFQMNDDTQICQQTNDQFSNFIDPQQNIHLLQELHFDQNTSQLSPDKDEKVEWNHALHISHLISNNNIDETEREGNVAEEGVYIMQNEVSIVHNEVLYHKEELVSGDTSRQSDQRYSKAEQKQNKENLEAAIDYLHISYKQVDSRVEECTQIHEVTEFIQQQSPEKVASFGVTPIKSNHQLIYSPILKSRVYTPSKYHSPVSNQVKSEQYFKHKRSRSLNNNSASASKIVDRKHQKNNSATLGKWQTMEEKEKNLVELNQKLISQKLLNQTPLTQKVQMTQQVNQKQHQNEDIAIQSERSSQYKSLRAESKQKQIEVEDICHQQAIRLLEDFQKNEKIVNNSAIVTTRADFDINFLTVDSRQAKKVCQTQNNSMIESKKSPSKTRSRYRILAEGLKQQRQHSESFRQEVKSQKGQDISFSPNIVEVEMMETPSPRIFDDSVIVSQPDVIQVQPQPMPQLTPDFLADHYYINHEEMHDQVACFLNQQILTSSSLSPSPLPVQGYEIQLESSSTEQRLETFGNSPCPVNQGRDFQINYMETLHTDCLSKKSSEERIVSVMAPNKIDAVMNHNEDVELQDKIRQYLDDEVKQQQFSNENRYKRISNFYKFNYQRTPSIIEMPSEEEERESRLSNVTVEQNPEIIVAKEGHHQLGKSETSESQVSMSNIEMKESMIFSEEANNTSSQTTPSVVHEQQSTKSKLQAKNRARAESYHLKQQSNTTTGKSIVSTQQNSIFSTPRKELVNQSKKEKYSTPRVNSLVSLNTEKKKSSASRISTQNKKITYQLPLQSPTTSTAVQRDIEKSCQRLTAKLTKPPLNNSSTKKQSSNTVDMGVKKVVEEDQWIMSVRQKKESLERAKMEKLQAKLETKMNRIESLPSQGSLQKISQNETIDAREGQLSQRKQSVSKVKINTKPQIQILDTVDTRPYPTDTPVKNLRTAQLSHREQSTSVPQTVKGKIDLTHQKYANSARRKHMQNDIVVDNQETERQNNTFHDNQSKQQPSTTKQSARKLIKDTCQMIQNAKAPEQQEQTQVKFYRRTNIKQRQSTVQKTADAVVDKIFNKERQVKEQSQRRQSSQARGDSQQRNSQTDVKQKPQRKNSFKIVLLQTELVQEQQRPVLSLKTSQSPSAYSFNVAATARTTTNRQHTDSGSKLFISDQLMSLSPFAQDQQSLMTSRQVEFFKKINQDQRRRVLARNNRHLSQQQQQQ